MHKHRCAQKDALKLDFNHENRQIPYDLSTFLIKISLFFLHVGGKIKKQHLNCQFFFLIGHNFFTLEDLVDQIISWVSPKRDMKLLVLLSKPCCRHCWHTIPTVSQHSRFKSSLFRVLSMAKLASFDRPQVAFTHLQTSPGCFALFGINTSCKQTSYTWSRASRGGQRCECFLRYRAVWNMRSVRYQILMARY